MEENDLEEIFISIYLGMKTDGHLIHLKHYLPYKSDTIIISIDELEQILEIASNKRKKQDNKNEPSK